MFIRDMKRQTVKSALTIGTVVIAVALCIAMVIAITSIKEQYRNLADEQSSSADLLLTSYFEKIIGESTLDLSNLSENVQDTIKFYSTDCYYKPATGKYCNLSFIAADFKLESKYKGLTLLQGKYAGNESECVITNQMAEQYNIKIGDLIKVLRGENNYSYKIVGIVDNKGIATENLGRCILTNIYNYKGVGQPVFKLILKNNTSVEDFKQKITDEFGKEYRIEYPEGKAEEFINSMDAMFDGMMGFALLAVILSGMFISMVLKEYVIGMRKTFAIVKALGGTRKNIILIVLNRVMIISAIGIGLGCVLGVILARGIVAFISTFLDSGSQTISISYNPSMIIACLIFCFLVIIGSTWNKILKSSRESVLEGFKEYKTSLSKKRIRIWIVFGGLIIGILGDYFSENSNLKLLCNILMVSMLIIIISELLFWILSKLFCNIIGKINPILVLLNKNNLLVEKRKSLNIVILFSTIIAFSLGILFSVAGIIQSIEHVADTMFYGDLVVESDIGFSSELENKLGDITGISDIQKNYEKIIDINDTEVKIKGIYTADSPYDLDDNQRENLKNKNSIIISSGLAKRMGLNTGDSITIPIDDNEKTFRIIGTIKTMEHDGKIILMSQNKFQNYFKDYDVNSLLIIKDKGISDSQLKENIKQVVDDNSIYIKSIGESKKDYISSNSSLIYLFYGLIVILLLSGMLMIINTTINLIKENEYSKKIEKVLGTSISLNILSQTIFGIFIGVISGITGCLGGRLIGSGFAVRLNESEIYNIIPSYKLSTFLLFIGISALITILSSVISSCITYKKLFGHTGTKGE